MQYWGFQSHGPPAGVRLTRVRTYIRGYIDLIIDAACHIRRAILRYGALPLPVGYEAVALLRVVSIQRAEEHRFDQCFSAGSTARHCLKLEHIDPGAQSVHSMPRSRQ